MAHPALHLPLYAEYDPTFSSHSHSTSLTQPATTGYPHSIRHRALDHCSLSLSLIQRNKNVFLFQPLFFQSMLPSKNKQDRIKTSPSNTMKTISIEELDKSSDDDSAEVINECEFNALDKDQHPMN